MTTSDQGIILVLDDSDKEVARFYPPLSGKDVLDELQKDRTGRLYRNGGVMVAAGNNLEAGTYRFCRLQGRGSDDASAQNHGGSPKLTESKTQTKTAPLGGDEVTLEDRFPNIKHFQNVEVAHTLQTDSLHFASSALLEPVAGLMCVSPKLDTEASLVHVLGQVLQQALILFPGEGVVKFDTESQAEGFSVTSDGQSAELAHEKYIRAGTFKGRIELQVVHYRESGGMLFLGAVEVKKGGTLEDHIEQAKKEAFAMWCHNALKQSYKPVWVVLSNVEKVLRITYVGNNYPGGGAKPYKKRMHCIDVSGEMRSTPTYMFASMAEGKLSYSDTRGVHVFIGGLLDGVTDTSEATLRNRLKQHKEAVNEQVKYVVRANRREEEARAEREEALAKRAKTGDGHE